MLRSFPISITGRENWFSIDPQSFNIEQLNAYKKAVRFLIHTEKKNLKRLINHSNARIRIYHRGINLAQKTMKMNLGNVPYGSVKATDCFDPKSLTSSQLELCKPLPSNEETVLCADILGITEELRYENERIVEVKNESTIHLSAYQLGLKNVNAGEVQYSMVMLIVVLF